MSLNDDYKNYLMNTYAPFPVNFVKGDGIYIYDDNNKKYIDFTSGIGVNSLGFNNATWKESIINQLNSFQHLSNIFISSPTVELAKKLTEISCMSKAFFSNSGAEANECAIKLARKYSFTKYGPNRNKILTLKQSFHGRTMATLKATGQEKFHNYFFPFPEGFEYVQANSIEDFKEKLHDDVCAVIMEAIQGEGGVLPLDKEFAKVVYDICKEKDVLVIFDEVQCGIARTGALFGYNQFDIQPDIVTLAKGLGSGLPIGAVLCNENLSQVFVPGDHGSTYGGNPIACAGALSVLDQLCNDSYYSKIKTNGQLIKDTINNANLSIVKEVRGHGLMIGIEITEDSSKIQKAALEKGLLVLTAGKNVVRLLPPLVIEEAEIIQGLNILIHCLSSL